MARTHKQGSRGAGPPHAGQARTANHAIRPVGLVDGRFRVVGTLGSGGMADVYLALDERLGREVALKVLSRRFAGDREFVERFEREARAAATLSHPNIVSIHDRGETQDGVYYIVMECLPGGTLRACVRRQGVG